MKTVSALLALCEGNPLVGLPHKGLVVMQSFDYFFVVSLN